MQNPPATKGSTYPIRENKWRNFHIYFLFVPDQNKSSPFITFNSSLELFSHLLLYVVGDEIEKTFQFFFYYYVLNAAEIITRSFQATRGVTVGGEDIGQTRE